MIPGLLNQQSQLLLGVGCPLKTLRPRRVNLVGGIVGDQIHSVSVLENLVKQRVLVLDRGCPIGSSSREDRRSANPWPVRWRVPIPLAQSIVEFNIDIFKEIR